MKNFIVKREKQLDLIHMQKFGRAYIDRKYAQKLVDEKSTGKTLRIGQTWTTKHEVVVNGIFYVVSIKDGHYAEIQEGSDL